MVSDEIRNAILQWRFITACPLLVAALTCSAKSSDSNDDAGMSSTPSPSASWHYRDYLLYNALPTATMSN
ncbi:MAG: hypothetical protein E6Q76_15305, partial [Rhizobium sp.]